MNTLFRLQELNAGSIKVDGIDIATLGLTALRSSLAILPQGALPPALPKKRESELMLFLQSRRSCPERSGQSEQLAEDLLPSMPLLTPS